MKWTKEKTYLELNEARRLMGLRSTTFEMYEGLFKGLGLALIHAPDSLTDIVRAVIIEAEKRRHYVLFTTCF